MNAFRLVTILSLVLALATIAHSQQSGGTAIAGLDAEAASASSATEELAINASSNRRRATTAHLFTNAKNPFERSTETDSSTVSQEPDLDDKGEWQFRLTPYLWIASVSGRSGLGNLVVNVDSGLTDDNVDLNFGFMITFEARKNRWVFVTDLQYSNLGTENPTPGPLFSSATAQFKTFVLDPEVGYRIVEDREKGNFIDVGGGIRYWRVGLDLAFAPGILPAVTVDRSRSWVDGVGAIRGKAHLTKRLFLTGKADLGGGGSNLTYQILGGVGVLVGKRFALIGAYRHLDVNYNKDDFVFDVALTGPVLGMSIRF